MEESSSSERQVVVELLQAVIGRLEYRAKTGPRPFKQTPEEFEQTVAHELSCAAEGAGFEGAVTHLGGHAFPDILLANRWGIEVKSSQSAGAKLLGNSVMESTRSDGIEDVFVVYGQMGAEPTFIFRPYFECVVDIKVTHSPRYVLDLTINSGDDIFAKMGTTYDEFAKLEDPVRLIADHYRSLLKPGQSLWWAGGPDGGAAVSPVIAMWNSLESEVRSDYIAQGFARFPELLSSSASKYDRLAVWLTTTQGIVSPNLRDAYSAGGRIEYQRADGSTITINRMLATLVEHWDAVLENIVISKTEELETCWGCEIPSAAESRIDKWVELIIASSERGAFVPDVIATLRTQPLPLGGA